MSKVNWAAKYEHEFVSNFKLLQSAMQTLGIDKNVPVTKLVKAKLADNLEFAQWFRAFFDKSTSIRENSKPYEPTKERGIQGFTKERLK